MPTQSFGVMFLNVWRAHVGIPVSLSRHPESSRSIRVIIPTSGIVTQHPGYYPDSPIIQAFSLKGKGIQALEFIGLLCVSMADRCSVRCALGMLGGSSGSCLYINTIIIYTYYCVHTCVSCVRVPANDACVHSCVHLIV